MSFKDCIRRAADQGEITQQRAAELIERWNQLAREVLSPAHIRKQIADELEAEALEKKRIGLLSDEKRTKLVADVLGHKNRKGEVDPFDALTYLIEHNGQARFQDVEHKRKSILGQSMAKMEEFLHEFRKGAVTGDLRRRRGEAKARLENIVFERYGKNTGDAKAKELGAGFLP